MPEINNQEDFLRALRENPEWRRAVRAEILGDELLQLPAALEVLSKTLTKFISSQEQFNQRQEQFNQRQEQFNQRQEQFNRNASARFQRIESDISSLKGDYARSKTIEDATGIASDMGLQYIRTLTRADLFQMVQATDTDTATARSFRNADLVIEAHDGTDTRYVVMEISFTADHRDYGRATRNASLISQFTGTRAQAAIASVRNDDYVTQMVQSGAIHWHELEDRTLDPE